MLGLEDVHELNLDMLLCFDEFCRKEGLRYSIIGGTLLGAVRNKGFIPWDDDVDVFMSRPEYDRLAEITFLRNDYVDYQANSRYVFVGPGKGHCYPWIRFVDKATHVKHRLLMEQYVVPHLFIDVFPVDGVPDGEAEATAHCKKLAHLRKQQFRQFAKPGSGKSAYHKAAKVIAGVFLRIVNDPLKLTNEIERLARMYPYETSRFVSSTAISDFHMKPVPKELFEETVYLELEGHKFPALAGWDEWLTGRYGDYMTPKPAKPNHFSDVWVDDAALKAADYVDGLHSCAPMLNEGLQI